MGGDTWDTSHCLLPALKGLCVSAILQEASLYELGPCQVGVGGGVKAAKGWDPGVRTCEIWGKGDRDRSRPEKERERDRDKDR